MVLFIRSVFVWLAVLSLCVPSGETMECSVLIAGSGDSQDLLLELGRAFVAAHPGLVVEVGENLGSPGARAGAAWLSRN